MVVYSVKFLLSVVRQENHNLKCWCGPNTRPCFPNNGSKYSYNNRICSERSFYFWHQITIKYQSLCLYSNHDPVYLLSVKTPGMVLGITLPLNIKTHLHQALWALLCPLKSYCICTCGRNEGGGGRERNWDPSKEPSWLTNKDLWYVRGLRIPRFRQKQPHNYHSLSLNSPYRINQAAARAGLWMITKPCLWTRLTSMEHVGRIFEALSNTWRASIPRLLLVWFINGSANVDRMRAPITATDGAERLAAYAIQSAEYLQPTWSFLNHQLHLYVKLTI